jgi:hypothetical protein
MRLVMTLVVRDEEELLAANLDYHLARGVDLVLVTDHGSTDATPEILDGYARRGLVEVFREDGDALLQGPWVTRMARRAASEHGADWVLNNDADEFWWPVAGSLKDVLAVVPERYGQLLVPRRNFLPSSGEGPFCERMTLRESRSANLLGEELEPKALHRGRADVDVPPGNHRVEGPGMNAAGPFGLIEVLHFPIRTYEQFERKVRKDRAGLGAVRDRAPDVGRDQLALAALQERGELLEWFETEMRDERRIEERLASGDLVPDGRLAGFMAALGAGGPAPEVPEAERLALRRVADALFGEAGRAEVAEGRAASAEDRLAHREHELVDAVEALERVRNSRLFRWTHGARRGWYRLRGRAG